MCEEGEQGEAVGEKFGVVGVGDSLNFTNFPNVRITDQQAPFESISPYNIIILNPLT